MYQNIEFRQIMINKMYKLKIEFLTTLVSQFMISRFQKQFKCPKHLSVCSSLRWLICLYSKTSATNPICDRKFNFSPKYPNYYRPNI